MVGEVAEEPAAERTHQEGRREHHGGVQLLHDRVVAGEEGRGEVERECRIGVEVVPLDEIADGTDEDRLDPPFRVGDVEMLGGRLRRLLCHTGLSAFAVERPTSPFPAKMATGGAL
jgi:hypothetical protein